MQAQPGMHIAPGLPCTSIVDTFRDQAGNGFVMLRIETAVGMTVVFIDPQHAKNLAANLHRRADEAVSALVIVSELPTIPTPEPPRG